MTNDLSIHEAKTEELAVTKVVLSSEWREHLTPKTNEFFDCRVTHVEKDGSIWIVEKVNADRIKRLSDNMARCMQKREPCKLEEIAIGDLVCVAFDEQMHRGEIMDLKSNSKRVAVRLIDNGTVNTIDVQDIYLAVPQMAETKAYAVRVILSSKTGMDLNKLTNVTLRLVGDKTVNGIHQAELRTFKTIPLDLPIQMLSSHPEVILLKAFQHNVTLNEPQVALVQIKKWNNLTDDLNPKNVMKFIEPFPKTVRIFFLLARTERGYRRAFLIDYIEEASKFLVYEMDEGRITITDEVRRIPNHLLEHPPRVFAVSLTPGNKLSLRQTISKCGRRLSIKFQDNSNMEKQRSVQATLLAKDNKEQVCDVRVDKFLGRIAELGLRYWQEPIENGSLVYITHVVNYHTICISSVRTKQYTDIFESLGTKCLPFGSTSKIPNGTTVLVVCPAQGYYRAEVIDKESDLYAVRNIDTGIDTATRVPLSYLRKSCAFLDNLPISQCRGSIKTLHIIKGDAVPPNSAAYQLLMQLYENKSQLKVDFAGSECGSLDLLDVNAEPPSLSARMLPLLFTASSANLKHDSAQNSPVAFVDDGLSIVGLPPLPPSPPDTPGSKAIGRHYFDDLKRELIPLGDNVCVTVIFATNLHKTGYIMACSFPNSKARDKFQYLLSHVNDFVMNEDKSFPGYLPHVGEMCLTLFSEDNLWYRGVCVNLVNDNQQAEIYFCDFGNTEVVSLEKIKPISPELLFTVNTTKCFIDGFNKSKDFKILEEKLAINNTIACSVLQGPERNTRTLKIPN
ncbi:uncharacterized protein LOC117788114 [Drosophila innubila]|uniref:uncharacterized protein LOC117788114 n=1 Tax=Drosophila innubila TaxID=198719 RepID=UPI00148C960F|nr:uncharacterized protein LOC117788114 [Drosophila innubila]